MRKLMKKVKGWVKMVIGQVRGRMDYPPLTNGQLYVILKCFHRPSDAVLRVVIEDELKRYGFNGYDTLTAAILENLIRQFAYQHMLLTPYGQNVWMESRRVGLL